MRWVVAFMLIFTYSVSVCVCVCVCVDIYVFVNVFANYDHKEFEGRAIDG